ASAVTQAVLATLKPGDHMLFDVGTYYEFASIFVAFGRRWGVAVDRVDLADLDAVGRALQPGRTRLVWLECPTNPLWRVPDIAAVAALAHDAGALLLVDATAATPVLCTPLGLGADLVLHSGTKYLNGHGDVLAGVLVTAATGPAWQEIAAARTQHGSVLSPFEGWLLLRGMRTLALRMERISASCLRIAQALTTHPAVTAVHYPGLECDRWHAIAAKQFTGGFGGMLSFETGETAEAALAVLGRLGVFRRATSLGSTESLAEHRWTTEGPGSLCPPTLIRLSVGLEDPIDLIDDLAQALRG
ncbi:MAG: PLP-dependent aspartate aminotransferase family protein, partial [Acetobacteraceae bacterium]|nr:PLP-dependent aspartate aminotransferase family protein [Acetobacteraceae bacterium]